MDTNAKISFIPKKPLAKRDFLERQPVSLFLVLSFSIFFITSAVYGGSYLYARSLSNGIDAKKAQLEDIKSKFDLSIIDKAKDLRARIGYAQGIIDKHITLSSFFDFLGQVTLRSIGYKSFQYSSEKDGKLEVTLSGMGPDYASVALQRDALALEVGQKEHLADFSMGGYTLDSNGNVNFNLMMTLNPAPFLYQKDLSTFSVGSGMGSGVNTASSSPQLQ
jgi:hypothetical protein